MAAFTKTGLLITRTLMTLSVVVTGLLSDTQSANAQQMRGNSNARRTIAYGNAIVRGVRNGLPSVYRGTAYSQPYLNGTSTNTLSYCNSNFAGSRNGLPPTRLDSFVSNAGGHAEHIYGDEGADGLPPYNGYNTVHRINTGIMGDRDLGLTTGHGSYMPDAVGADEFLAPPGEWSQSGVNNGDHQYNHAADALDAAQAQGSTGGGNGQISEGELAAHPKPGDDYQPMFQHGVFVGWWSPAEIALSQTDFPAALRLIMASDRFWGDAYSIKVEIGDLPWP